MSAARSETRKVKAGGPFARFGGASADAARSTCPPATAEEACQRVRDASTPVSGPPVVLITLYDGQMNISMRYLYAALVGGGHSAKIIRFGHTVPYEHNLDYSLFQTLKVKFPLARPAYREADAEALVERVAALEPLWVGLNVIAPHNHVAADLTRRLRERLGGGVALVWGGYMAINEPEWCLQHADAVCVGEGEEVAVEISGRLKARDQRGLAGIAGLWRRGRDGEIEREPRRPLLPAERLEALPLLFFERTEDELFVPENALTWYVNQAKADGGKSNSATVVHDVLFTRGCFFTCTFCFHNVQIGRERGQGLYYRPADPRWIVEYLKDAKDRLGKERFVFWEDIFPYDTDWLREFCALYKAEIGLPFSVNFHPKMVREENVRLLADAGMDSCNMGFQSGSERVRREVYGRNETNEEILEGARILNKHAWCCYDTIIDNPFETEEDLRASFELFIAFPHHFVVDTNTLLYFRNQDITKKALAAGLIGEDQVLGSRAELGYQDVTCTGFLPRRDARKRALTMLIVATQYDFIPREKLRRWFEDDALLSNDRRLAVLLLTELYRHTRHTMHEYEANMHTFASQLGSAPMAGKSPAQ
ncbi:MAG: radical SAM protein [Sumerlaeia bacterium]